MDVEFEWDDNKAASNLKKHGVSFPLATRVFSDPYRIERRDDRGYEEDRFITVGLVGNMELTVLYTPRGNDTLRIISARKADRNEQNSYWKNR